ncbi:MAG: antibiotic biosynthesis monooxygenase [Acidimicrobiales bacterium]|nr:antibiotic biosynthesis monooxygenase [Acidimicrobiales bacterium]
MAETPDVDLQIVTLVLDTADPGALAGVLSRYVVLSRAEPGCRNIDLAVSATVPGRFVVVEKWETPTARRAHLDGETMVAMAEACRGLLTRPPAIDLLEPISAHDLR